MGRMAVKATTIKCLQLSLHNYFTVLHVLIRPSKVTRNSNIEPCGGQQYLGNFSGLSKIVCLFGGILKFSKYQSRLCLGGRNVMLLIHLATSQDRHNKKNATFSSLTPLVANAYSIHGYPKLVITIFPSTLVPTLP